MKASPGQHSRDSIREAAARWIARRDAGLTPDEAAEFERWRTADPRHAAALSHYERLWSALDRPRGQGAGAEVQRGLALLRRRDRRRRTAAAAAALVLVAGLGWWSRLAVSPSASVSEGVVEIVQPERRVLPDGSLVEHSTQSLVEIDFSSPHLRRVKLHRGEAHFQVEHDPARPFVVMAGGTEVRAVGTAFAVQLGSASVEVVVTQGRVAVQPALPAVGESVPALPAPPTRGDSGHLVDSGHRLVVKLNAGGSPGGAVVGPVEAISAAELDQRLAWRNLRLEFSGTPLSEVIATFNRHAAARSGVRFVLAEADLMSVPFSGVIRGDDSEAVVRILEHGFGLRADRRGEGEVVLSRPR